MPRIIHPLAGLVSILTIATFWLSTVIAELFASEPTILAVKTAIPWGFILLVPALAILGGSGLFLSKGQRQGLIGTKLKRMPFIAANGLLVLVPAALFLALKAKTSEFDATFYTVQVLELIVGAVNIILLGLSMRDGMVVTQWRRKSVLRPAAHFTSRMTGKEEVAMGTLALRLNKPEGFKFVAGQAVYIVIPDLKKADTKGKVRIFSIASAPQDVELEIATRQTNTSFKHCLTAAKVGSPIQVEGPYGDMVLHEDELCPAVLIAGGIGVTPFRSMLFDAFHRGLQHQLFLFYSNRLPADAAYLTELHELEKKNPRFKLIATFTEAGVVAQDKSAEHGYITAHMLAKHVGDLTTPIFYIAGPPTMVSAMEVVLKSAGVHQVNVHAEKFSGY